MLKRLICAALVVSVFGFTPASAAGVTVFAAASLSDALTDVGKTYQAKSGAMPSLSFAASSALARQIEASGGADIFISADMDWMEYLDSRGLIAHETLQEFARKSFGPHRAFRCKHFDFGRTTL